MSSDKAPEKLYYDFINNEITRTEVAFSHTYIRADLIPSDDSYVDYLKERTAYEEQQEKEAIARAERKREMFEKVALACLEGAGVPNFDFFVNHTIPAVRKIVDEILSEADKFARGEK